MNNTATRTILSIFLAILVIIAGVFCYQGVQTMNMHCSGDTSSVWCSDFLSHGTIVSEATLTIVFTTLSILVAIVLIKPFLHLFNNIRQTTFYTLKVRDRIPIFSPIQIAISDGIIHPRIP